MNQNIAKKIFRKDQAEEFLKIHKPELFGKRNGRCKTIIYLGNDLYSDICSVDINTIKEYVRNYSITEGKYAEYHKDPEYFKGLIAKSKIDKSNSPCRPQQFSESVVKPDIRNFISKKMNPDDIKKYVFRDQLMDKLLNHYLERINQQVKADWSEYLILMNCENIIPTLKQTKGTDMYLVKDDGSIEDLDIKTTRNIWGIDDKKEAIKALYEKQDPDRFSDDPRLYIYLSDKELCDSENIVKQLNEVYEIEFIYNKKNYKVIGCRLVII